MSDIYDDDAPGYCVVVVSSVVIVFFYATATPAIYALSLHDALPISDPVPPAPELPVPPGRSTPCRSPCSATWRDWRSEEHTSELQSQSNLVCRLLLEKKRREKYAHGTATDERIRAGT